MYNQLTFNPAVAGSVADHVGVSLQHRQQWNGLSNGLQSTAFTLHTGLVQNRIGVGVRVLNEQDKANSITDVGFIGKYKIRVFKGELSFGLDLGLKNQKQSFDRLVIFNQNDPGLSTLTKTTFETSSGLFYQREKTYLGFSLRHLQGVTNNGIPHLYFTGAHQYKISEIWSLYPSFIIRNRGQVTFFEVNLQLRWENAIWIGGAVRSTNQYSIQMGVHLNELMERILNPMALGYAYDIGKSDLFLAAGTTHEIFFNYYLKKVPVLENINNRRKHISPLFF